MRGAGAGVTLASMEDMDRLVLEIAHGSGVPFGWLSVSGRRQPFRGFAELVSEVQRVRSGEAEGDEGEHS